MTLRYSILEALADGKFHSGRELGDDLGISRTAVWKHIKSLQGMGLDVFSIPGRGYQLASSLELLDATLISRQLDSCTLPKLSCLEIHPVLNSTNSHLMSKLALGVQSGYACIAEQQLQGRGRRGRQWHSPFGQNLYLSLLWRFSTTPANLGCLSLVMAVAVAQALEQVGVKGVGVKWPNDLLWQGKKLAGILLEMTGESAGPCAIIIGIGLNVNMKQSGTEAIDQPWVDVVTAAGKPVSRNTLAGKVLHQVITALGEVEHQRSERLLEKWTHMDVYRDTMVSLYLHDEVVVGKVRGIDSSGALLLQRGDRTYTYQSGEISLRAVQ